MAITITERHRSRDRVTGDTSARNLRYVVKGTASDSEAEAALLEQSPVTYDGKPRQNVSIDPIFVDITNPEQCKWAAVVRYSKHARPATGDNVFSFDTGGGTEHITQSLATVRAYGASGYTASTDDHGGAIGVTSQGRVEGVDIIVPTFQWGERHYLDAVYVTKSYINALFHLTSKVNEGTFRGKEPCEVIFLGASGSKRGMDDDTDWEISYRFAARPNAWDLEVGSITGIVKRGWEYLWVEYEEDLTGSGNDERSRPRPARVYIEKVYRYGDFARMGIGT